MPQRPPRLRAVAAALSVLAGVGCSPPQVTDAGRDATLDATATCSSQPIGLYPDAGCPVLGGDDGTCFQLEVGTGRDGTVEGYRALRSGDHVWLTPGEQGLQHILIAFRGDGFDRTAPLVEARLLRASDCEEVGYARYSFPFRPVPADGGPLGLEALRLTVMDDFDRFEYCSILDRDVTLVVNFDDRRGLRVHREVRLHVDGIDPAVRPEIRTAWQAACLRGGMDP